MSVITWAHGRTVGKRRVRRLVDHLLPRLPTGSVVLDIGAGDGHLAAGLLERSPTLIIEGVDVLVRPDAAIRVSPFDGVTVPWPDRSVDYTLLIDVLHHAQDPLQLLREALRVSRVGVVLKDHLAERRVDHVTLRLMDWVGNAGHGVRLPYRYLSHEQWGGLFSEAGGQIVNWQDRLSLYPTPVGLVFDRRLHFVALVRPGTPSHQSSHAAG